MARPWKLKPAWDKQASRFKLYIPPVLSVSGRRERRFFKTEEEARAYANRLRIRYNRFGASLRHLSSERMVEASQAFKALDEHKEKTGDAVTLREVVSGYLQEWRKRSGSVTLDALFAEYFETKKHRSSTYLQQIRYCQRKCGPIGPLLVCDIQPAQIEHCLASMPLGNKSVYMRFLRAIFNLGIKRGYLQENPILRLDFPHRPRQEVYVLPNSKVRAMLNYTLEHERDCLAFLVLSFFCGIRTSELKQIAWNDIDTENNRVVIRSAYSKTRRKRFVPLPDNAKAWLALCKKPVSLSFRITSKLTNQTLTTARQRVWKAVSNRPFPHNCGRHTFASCFAALNPIDDLTLCLGHDSSKITFERYAAGVTKEHAIEFFSIVPNS
jgi:integrase/recombinase XerD